MGAEISGEGTPAIEVSGVAELHAADHTVIGDRIEAGTFLIAAAATRGDVTVTGIVPESLDLVLAKLTDAGATVDAGVSSVRVALEERPDPVDFVTLPYPGFPTDLQPQMMVLLATAEGTSIATENVFESRFMFVDELIRMGADIRTEGRHAVIRGVERLSGCPVRATDVRAGAALVLAGLAAEGQTEVHDVVHVDRGYRDLPGSLAALGADVTRVTV